MIRASPSARGGNFLLRLAGCQGEVIHRVRSDPGRHSERWFRDVVATSLGEEEYVETVSIVAHVVAIETMARGMGFEPLPERCHLWRVPHSG